MDQAGGEVSSCLAGAKPVESIPETESSGYPPSDHPHLHLLHDNISFYIIYLHSTVYSIFVHQDTLALSKFPLLSRDSSKSAITATARWFLEMTLRRRRDPVDNT